MLLMSTTEGMLSTRKEVKEMIRMTKRFISVVVIVMVIFSMIVPVQVTAAATENGEIHVATNGSVDGSGTADDPINDIQVALDMVQEIVNSGTQAKVYIHGGTYYADEPIVLKPEHSGTSDNPTLIQAYNGEKVVISGGSRINSWDDEGNGIVSAKLHNYDSVGMLRVNGKAADNARMGNTLLENLGNTTYSWLRTGIIVDSSEIPAEATMEDGFIVCYYKWQIFRFKTTKIEDYGDGQKVIYLDAPFSVYQCTQGLSALSSFYLENDKAFLDEPGEFFFDKKEKRIYYMLRNGESIDNINAYIGKEEKLMKIEGESAANKVSNIVVDGLVFANVAWQEARDHGFYMNQSVQISPTSNADVYECRDTFGAIPAAVRINHATNVSVINCDFNNIDKVALAMYDGVQNCKITGNTFADISASAISVGTSAHTDEDAQGKYNVAYQKPAWTTNTYITAYASYATDDYDLTCWEPEYTRDTEDFFIDLQGEYKITGVEIVSSGDSSITSDRKNFRVDVSNDIDFVTYETIATQGDTPCSFGEPFTASYDGGGQYRYVRFVKTDGGVMCIRKFRVFTDDEQGRLKEVCKNNTISNNYITRIGTTYEGSPAIHSFKTSGLRITNNYIYDIPYTAISLGWGWSVMTDSTTCKNNYVGYNRLEKIMQKRSDGGAVYTLGNLGGTVLEYNYVKDAIGEPGGFYPDEGSDGMTIRYNVVDTADEWLQIWTTSIKNITAQNNYYKDASVQTGGTNCVVNNNTKYYSYYVPDMVNTIINGAGLENTYTDIVSRVTE